MSVGASQLKGSGAGEVGGDCGDRFPDKCLPPPPPLPPRSKKIQAHKANKARAPSVPAESSSLNHSSPNQTPPRSAQERQTATIIRHPPVTAELPPQQTTKTFRCQLAHGSPNGVISGLNSIRDVYEKIAQCFDVPVADILFCTLNTHKVDMRYLLGSQLGLQDFIFAHLKGSKKEAEVVKEADALGLTITDNGAGYAFIKRIRPGTTAHKLGNAIKVGDHIEKLNDEPMVGRRHFEVARALRDIPVGSRLKIRLIEPLQAGFSHVAPRSKKAVVSALDGTQTIRFSLKGNSVIQMSPSSSLLEQLNSILETYFGISDEELALRIYEIGQCHDNPSGFLNAVTKAPDLKELQLPEDVICDLWGVLLDQRQNHDSPQSHPCSEVETVIKV